MFAASHPVDLITEGREKLAQHSLDTRGHDPAARAVPTVEAIITSGSTAASPTWATSWSCRRHHVAVHEGGQRLVRVPDGEIQLETQARVPSGWAGILRP